MTAAPPSILQRLTRVLVLASIAWGVAVSAVVWLAVHHEVDEIMDQALRESAEVLYGTISQHLAMMPAGDARAMPAPPHDEHLVWQIVDAQGLVRSRSHQAPQQALGRPATTGLWTVNGHWRVCGMAMREGPYTLLVAQRMPERVESRFEAATVTAALALAVGLLCAGWLSVLARRELRPLQDMSQALEHYDPLQEARPLAPASRAELQPMRQAIAALGQRLTRHIANERAVAGHAAHALRTPLAGLVAQLAAAQKVAPEATQPALQRARQAADRLRRVVGALITLFRSGAELNRQTVDAAALWAHLPAPGVELSHHGARWIDADPDLLAAALSNLVDNAVRQGARKVSLQVTQPSGAAQVQRLVITDDGPGCAPERQQELRGALDRQDYAAAGIGLGLMLADLVARAHDGRLSILPAERGFAAELAWSAAPAAPA